MAKLTVELALPPDQKQATVGFKLTADDGVIVIAQGNVLDLGKLTEYLPRILAVVPKSPTK